MTHAPEYASEVRTLAQRLAAGRISWAEYREERAATIGAIVRGEKPLTYGPPVIFGNTEQPDEHDLAQVLIDLDAVEARAPRRWPAFIAVAGLAIVIAVAGWAIWRSLQPPIVASAPVVQMAPAEGVLHRFLVAEEWSADAMQQTVDAWQALSADERAAARRTATWRRLQNQVREQLNQQQVLATVDETGEAAEQERRLRAFQAGLED